VFNVSKAVYTKHNKKDKSPTLKCTYFCGLRQFSEYLCFEHRGYPLQRAKEWWKQRSNTSAPTTVDEALVQIAGLRVPARIRVALSAGFPEVLSHEF
jgi:DNA repair protein RadD